MTSNRELARQLGVSETAVRRAEKAGRIRREGGWLVGPHAGLDATPTMRAAPFSRAISAQRCDDPADPLDIPERLFVGQARPLHAQQDMVGPGGLGVAQDLVLHLLSVADQEPVPGEAIEGGVEVVPRGLALTPGGVGAVLEQQRPPARRRGVRGITTDEAFADQRQLTSSGSPAWRRSSRKTSRRTSTERKDSVGAMHQASAIRAARRTAGSTSPPSQIGGRGLCLGLTLALASSSRSIGPGGSLCPQSTGA
jgi:hypothetical protein